MDEEEKQPKNVTFHELYGIYPDDGEDEETTVNFDLTTHAEYVEDDEED